MIGWQDAAEVVNASDYSGNIVIIEALTKLSTDRVISDEEVLAVKPESISDLNFLDLYNRVRTSANLSSGLYDLPGH